MKNKIGVFFIAVITILISAVTGLASVEHQSRHEDNKSAIVIASFGTTVPEAIKSITNIVERTRAAYPETEVRVTFTSNIIRSVWRKRQAEAKKWLDKGIPEEILYVKNVISTVGDLIDDGYRSIIVQPTHIFFMEQSSDLQAYIDGLASIKTTKEKWMPFDKLVMARPALGMPGNRYDYHVDLARAVDTLAGDVDLARKEKAMLLYMAHGNEHWSTGIYTEAQKKMREVYPDVPIFVATVEGYPSLHDIKGHLSHPGIKKVVLKPFMIVAGDHAMNDMVGPEPDSWKSVLEKEDYYVLTVLEGLGSNNDFADIFVKHIKDTAIQNGIILK